MKQEVSTVFKNKHKNDEFITPAYAVIPLIKYLKPNSSIWCPFDTEDSMYVRELKRAGHDVVYTHIEDKHINGDFFYLCNHTNAKWADYIISNPPYSLKEEVLAKLFSLGIPFAMLVGNLGLFDSKSRWDMFRTNKFEMMVFDKRVKFSLPDLPEEESQPPFASVYITSGILPEQIVFEELKRK